MCKYGLAFTLLVTSLASFGCGSSNEVWITGTLLKGGTKFTPPAGRQVGISFYLVSSQDKNDADAHAGDPYQADYNESDGTFSVPGREGRGIPPGKYRVAISQKMTREAFDKLHKSTKIKPGTDPAVTRDTDFFSASYGPSTSPITREFTSSAKVTIDLDKPE